jgi:outer membrane protein OmpA-like peptidoglycan-associated protein
VKFRVLITAAAIALFTGASHAQTSESAAGQTIATPHAPPPSASATASICPDDFKAYADTTEPVVCSCSAAAVKRNDIATSVYGMDVYPGLSSVCRSALHAGVVGPNGGTVTVIPEPGRNAYPGVTRNGVRSENWGSANNSFRFAAAAQPAAVPPPAPPSASVTASICPDDFKAYADTTEPVVCACSAAAVKRNDIVTSVYGMDVYPGLSSVCRSALHAGAVGPNGGTVTVIPEPGRNAYPGVTRNGVRSENWGSANNSFRFAGAAQPAAAPPPPPSSASMTASICPDDFKAYADATEPVVCWCSAAAVKRNDIATSVYGMDVYPGLSLVCRSALHAGVVGANGGTVTVVPEPGRNAYPGVTRNGVRSENWGSANNSFRFAAAAQPVIIGNEPAQRPIAATIEETGQVQLYIRFRFDSAELDQAAGSTLTELRDALNANPELGLMLVGHTDAVGTRPYNWELSRRRAQAVMTWLVERGITPARLAVDGKGYDQPIADNATDTGRALNRRVQAIRVR